MAKPDDTATTGATGRVVMRLYNGKEKQSVGIPA
jgi:hypothetical protein